MNEAEKALIYCELRAFYAPEEARYWLDAPHPQLDGRRARDCTFAEVMAVIDRLKSGAFV